MQSPSPPGGRRSPAPSARSLTPAQRALPTRQSHLARQAAGAWGGPAGRHAALGRAVFWTPLRVCLAVAVLFCSLAFLSKAPCLETTSPTDGSAPSVTWGDGNQYLRACYNDPVALYGATGLDTGAMPYQHQWVEPDGQVRYMEYPVLTGMYQYGAAQLARAAQLVLPENSVEVVAYFVIVAIGLAIAWLVAIWATYRATGRRPWDTLLMAASPIVVFQLFTNFDALAIAATALALLAWSRGRHGLAGVAIGVGIAFKLYPLFLFGAFLVVALRSRAYLPVLRAAATAALTWLVVNLPWMILFPAGWREFYRLNQERPANPESLYNVVAGLTGWSGFDAGLAAGQAPEVTNAVSLVLFALCCAAILALGLRAPATPRVAQLAFLIVAAFLLTNKVWSPQFSLWLVPLAVLALPRLKVLLPWMAFDALLWVAHMSYFYGAERNGLNAEWFYVLVLVRAALVVVVCAVIVHEILRPHLDLVRRSHRFRGLAVGSDPLWWTPYLPLADADPRVRSTDIDDDAPTHTDRRPAPAPAPDAPAPDAPYPAPPEPLPWHPEENDDR